LQRVLVLIAGQNQDYKNAKVALCKFYSNNHCEGNNPFIALCYRPHRRELKGRRHFILKTVQKYQKVPFNKQIDRPILPVGSLDCPLSVGMLPFGNLD